MVVYRNVPLDFGVDKWDGVWTPLHPPSLAGIDEVYLDTETDGLDYFYGNLPIGIAVGWWDGDIFHKYYLPWGHNGGNLPEFAVKDWARRELRNKRIINLNTRFDIHMLYAWGIDLELQGCTFSDVQHYDALLNEYSNRFSLEDISQFYLGEGKVQSLDKTRMASYHAGQVADYAMVDILRVAQLKRKLYPELDKQCLQRVRLLEDEVIPVTCEMERNGVPLDVPLLHQWCDETEKLVNQGLYDIYKMLNFQFEPTPTGWVKLFRKLNIPIIHFTADGKPSFDDQVLRAHPDQPAIVIGRRVRKIMSMRSKFLLPYKNNVDSKGILRYNLHQLRMEREEGGSAGTISGRFSATKQNIQQVPKVAKQIKSFKGLFPDRAEDDIFLIRKLFIPEPGKQWLSADAKQIEYRLFAHYANVKKILQAYKDNPDLNYHEFVMEMIKPFKPDIVYGKTKDVNFAQIYGAGKAKTAIMLEMAMDAAEEFVGLYHRTFPEVKPLIKKFQQDVKRDGFVEDLVGRRSRCADRPHKALNGCIQGGAASVNKQKLVDLHREKKYTGLKLRLTVHDEADGDTHGEECTRRVAEVLDTQSFPDLRVPILWDVRSGANWSECR